MNTNDITPATTPTTTTTPATTTPAVDVATTPATPAKRASRKPVKPANAPAVRVPTSIADAFKIARTITGANIDEHVRAANVGHVVNAPGKNTGRFTSTRIVRFQNTTLLENVERKLTDVQLLYVWRVEFPSAVGRVFTADWKTGVSIVRGVRAEFNRNGHGEPERVPAGFKSEPFTGR